MNIVKYDLKQRSTYGTIDSLIHDAASHGMMVVSLTTRPTGEHAAMACDRMMPESVLKAFLEGKRTSVTLKDGVELNPPDNCEPIKL